jgi:hypothetical protein
MGCVHTHQRILTIKGWGSPNHVRSVVQKTRKDNRKVGKIGQAINYAPTPGSKQDKI